jgi:hypothetical protein
MPYITTLIAETDAALDGVPEFQALMPAGE